MNKKELITSAMAESGNSYETLLQFLYRIPIGLVQTSTSGFIELLNPMSSRLLMPLSRDGSLSNIFEILSDIAPSLQSMSDAYAMSSGVVCDSLRVTVSTSHHGEQRPCVLSISVLKLDDARLMFMLEDASQSIEREQVLIERKLEDAAHIDRLTSLPNRMAVVEYLHAGMEKEPDHLQQGLAILFINCDRFKQVNDTFGHHAGDHLLVTLAERLKLALREDDLIAALFKDDHLTARISSDEFVVVLNKIRRQSDLHNIADRVLNRLCEPYLVQNHQITCTVSMGVVMVPARLGRQQDADSLLDDASIAMAEAKKAGGARFLLFSPVMRHRAEQRGGLEVDLRQALKTGQIFVMYQPVVEFLADGGIDRCAGVEALARWRHPVRGNVPPQEFITIAEESGLIVELGEFVLASACREFMAWQQVLGDRAPKLLAVNLSKAQLLAPEWHFRVQNILRSAGMPAAQLQLEVTESLAAQDEAVRQGLDNLKSLGLDLSLDDFGTGYSSLASLHLLPVDTVKIDRSFVSKADTSAHHRVLIEATVRVAQSLNLGTVAEGIETEAQAAVVRQAGCAKAQGYLYSKPLASTDLIRWIDDGSAQR